VNDSPRAREPLKGIRRTNWAFRKLLAISSLPVPALLGVVVGDLILESIGAGSSTVDWTSLLEGTISMASVATFFALPMALAGALASRRVLSTRVRAALDVLLSGLSAMPMITLGFLFAQILGPAIRFHTGMDALGPGLATAALICGLLPVLWKRLLAAFGDVPAELSQGALALGARPLRVLLTIDLGAAMPEIARSSAAGFSRAAGESVIVLLVSGNTHTIWGGVDGAASLGPALLTLMADAQPGTPLWVEIHRLAILLLMVCVGAHVVGRHVRWEGAR